MFRIIFILTIISTFISCKQRNKEKKVEVVSECCDLYPPPPPPPPKNYIREKVTLNFDYKNGKTPVEIEMISDNLINYLDKEIQTYRIQIKSKLKNDTIYFAVPIEENNNWSNLTFSNANINNGIKIGYIENNNFYELYRLTLGSEINAGNVYLSNSKIISGKQNIQIIEDELIKKVSNLPNIKLYERELNLNSKRKLKIWSKGNYSIKNKEYLQISVGEENYISYSTRFNYLFNFETKELFFLNTETNKLTKIE